MIILSTSPLSKYSRIPFIVFSCIFSRRISFFCLINESQLAINLTADASAAMRLPFSSRQMHITYNESIFFSGRYTWTAQRPVVIFRYPRCRRPRHVVSATSGDIFWIDRAPRHTLVFNFVRFSFLQVINNFRPPMPLGNRVLRECGSF